jgi:SAM-dependent methyltransferase
MKILVAITNFGTGNRPFLERLLNEYRSMSHQVDLVVLSNIGKDLGNEVEVLVGLPTRDPWSLPFGHKKLFADRIADYDLFIYSEDDTLITERNVVAFLRATEVLAEDEIAGFLRTEQDAEGRRYFPEVHAYFRWDPLSLRARGGKKCAWFSNEHSACYILTRDQLRRAISSGGFLVPPHQDPYDLLVSAATDPYTQCGLTKLICVSELDDFLVPHLPNKYIGHMGLAESLFRKQIRVLLDQTPSELREAEWIVPNPPSLLERWWKDFYEPVDQHVLNAIDGGHRRILSVGAGWGALELALAQRGAEVTAVVADAVVGACIDDAVRVIPGPARRALDTLGMSNVLHLVDDPVELLRGFVALLRPGGTLVARVPNMRQIGAIYRRMLRPQSWTRRGKNSSGRMPFASHRKVVGWMDEFGVTLTRLDGDIRERYQKLNSFSRGAASSFLTDSYLLVGTRRGHQPVTVTKPSLG